MSIRAFYRLVLIAVFIFVPMLAIADPAGDAKIKALEEQLRQQQEQNRQIMETLKKMQGQQGSTPSTAQPVSATTAAPALPPGETFVPGWLARIMAVEEIRTDKSVSVQLTADELGRFLATKPLYNFKDYTKIAGIPRGARVGWKGEAFFETKDQGRHTFIINVKGENGLMISAGFSIEGNAIFDNQQQLEQCRTTRNQWENQLGCAAFTGGAELEPGRYKVEFRVLASDGGRRGGFDNLNFEVLTKKPSDVTPIPANQSLIVRAAK